MKDWVRLIISVSLLAPVFLISAPSLFAHKFPGRYKPAQNTARSVGTAATTRIPYVVNPRLTLSQQQRVAAFSGAVVDRSVSNRVVEAAHLATNHTPASPASGPITTNIHINAAAQISTLDNGTNLTGVEVLNTYFPAWRQELGGMFSPEQLDAVERTLAATDDWLFVRGEDGELQIRNPDEWDYEARFLTLLQESGVSFTEKQIKQLIGGKGIKGFTFKIYFFRMNALGFTCAKGTKPRQIIYQDRRRLKHEEMTPEEIQEVVIGQGLSTYGNHPAITAYMQKNRLQAETKTAEEYVALARQYDRKPRSDISRNGHILTREEMTPEEIQEVIIGEGLDRHRNHPLVQAYLQGNRLHAENKTPEEYVELARQYSTKPRSKIYRGGRKLSRKEMTPEEIQEVNIGMGLNRHSNHPIVIAYMQENRQIAESKTPEEYVALARQYPTKPRTEIRRGGHKLSRKEMTSEEVQEVNIGQGLYSHRNHPLVQAYLKENRQIAEVQTTPQLYTTLVTHIKEYGRYPMQKESHLYSNIYNRLRRYQSTMVDGKYQDPWLQKIYELKTAVQNAPEGKFTLTPDGQGSYILEIEEPVTEEWDVTAPQPVEEVIPAVPSPHTIRLRINEETKNLVLATRDQAALERREFPGWLRSMHRAENFPQIVDQNTFDALHVLNRAINFDYRNGQNRRAVTYLLETVNNYVGTIGGTTRIGHVL